MSREIHRKKGKIMKKTGSQAGMFLAGSLLGWAGLRGVKNRKVRRGFICLLAKGIKGHKTFLDQLCLLRENADDIYAEAKVLNKKTPIEDFKEV